MGAELTMRFNAKCYHADEGLYKEDDKSLNFGSQGK